MNKTTYLYEIHYKKGNEMSFQSVRGSGRIDAVKELNKIIGYFTLISVAVIGN